MIGAIPAKANGPDAAALAAMRDAHIVILGEIHDNPAHHEGQAKLIRALAPAAVVFEMLTPAQAAEVNQGPRGNLDALADRIGWADSGWPEFALYRPVFEALGDTPVVGAALPRDQVRAAFSEGAAAVFGDDAARWGLTDPLPDDQQALREKMQFDAHCAAMPMEMMDGMVEAQRLRDAHFSATALDALDAYGAPVVVIAGSGHARLDWGMPAALALAAPQVSVFAAGFVEAPLGLAEAPFDVTLVTDPAPRADPCAAFSR